MVYGKFRGNIRVSSLGSSGTSRVGLLYGKDDYFLDVSKVGMEIVGLLCD